MPNFLQLMLGRGSWIPPYHVKKLSSAEMQKLKDHCSSLQEITAIFSSVANINSAYRDKVNYVIKRVYELVQDETAYSAEGFNPRSRLGTPSLNGQPWQLGELPTDPEIVASVFCSVLDYAAKFTRRHLYDSNLTQPDIAKFAPTDITIANTQPGHHFRAHYEVYVGSKVYRTLIDMNLWFACMWVYAAIHKVHRGKYGSFDCKEAIEFIFPQSFAQVLDDLDF